MEMACETLDKNKTESANRHQVVGHPRKHEKGKKIGCATQGIGTRPDSGSGLRTLSGSFNKCIE